MWGHCICDNILRQIKCYVLNNTIRFSRSDCVADFVVGNIDMVTMEKKNTFPTNQVRTYNCTKFIRLNFAVIILGKHCFVFHLLVLYMFWHHLLLVTGWICNAYQGVCK